jgi:orotidine-5'-phosphate decarboxylase
MLPLAPHESSNLGNKSLAPFADRLAAALHSRGTPVVVGLDPRLEQLPPGLYTESSGEGVSLRDQQGTQVPRYEREGSRVDPVAAAAAYASFCRQIIDVVAPLVPAVKPQVAFFERWGSAGMAALEETIHYARQNSLLVIVDAKRNDIGSTAEAYAEAFLGPVEDPARQEAFRGDALTVSPYLGDDSLQPFVDAATTHHRGVFVLVKTSNPGGSTFQDLVCEGRPLYRHVATLVENLASQTKGGCGYGAVGAVVGATYPEQLRELRQAMPHAWILVPGYGSQGGTARDVAAAFDDRGVGALVNNSRGIIFAHARKEYARFGPHRWQEAVEAATKDMIAELQEVARQK